MCVREKEIWSASSALASGLERKVERGMLKLNCWLSAYSWEGTERGRRKEVCAEEPLLGSKPWDPPEELDSKEGGKWDKEMTKDRRTRQAVFDASHQATQPVFPPRASSDRWGPRDRGAALVVLLALWWDMSFRK